MTTISKSCTEATDFTYAAKNPGSWANNLKVCVIDDAADQTLGIFSNYRNCCYSWYVQLLVSLIAVDQFLELEAHASFTWIS